MPTPEEWLTRLIRDHDGQVARLKLLDAYYEGEQPLSYMHPELLAQLEDQVRQVVVSWPQLVVDAVEERCDIEGFRRPDVDSADEQIWSIWQASDMDQGSQRAHVDAMVMGRSYVTIGSPDAADDPPVLCDESALDMIHVADPKTREVATALRRWRSDGDDEQTPDMATLYLPDATTIYSKRRDGTWKVDSEDKHGLGVVPVVPILNRFRRRKQVKVGVSEMAAVLPLSDAACKIATDMMVGSNFHALPRYYATGVSESDFVDEDGNPVSVWKTVTGRIWATENEMAKLGQFPATDLANFHNTLSALGRLVSSVYGLPPHYLGYSTENPASAEGIKSSEARLIKRAERHHRGFEGSWEKANWIAMRFLTGAWDPQLRRLETKWRDPSTPTVGQKADATVKLFQAGIISKRQAREDLGYSPAQIARMEADDERAAAQDPLTEVARGLAGGGQPGPADGDA